MLGETNGWISIRLSGSTTEWSLKGDGRSEDESTEREKRKEEQRVAEEKLFETLNIQKEDRSGPRDRKHGRR